MRGEFRENSGDTFLIATVGSLRVGHFGSHADIGDGVTAGKELGDFWKYRVGDWRIIADIEDGLVLVTVVRIGNRREIYRR